MRPLGWSLALAAAIALAACGEKPQTLSGAKKGSAPTWQGVNNGFVDPGWKAGDEKSWEEHMDGRTRRGQNEYPRTSGAG